jgi:hypothetical protein
MATSPIDLSAGLVPKAGGIDLSTGLVPKDAAPAEKSLWQKAKDKFNANTQGAQPGDGAIKGFIENVGQGGGQALSALAHPLDTLSSMGHMVAHPLDQAHADVAALYADPSRFIGNAVGQVGTGAILGEAAGRMVAPTAEAARSTVGRALLLGKTPEGAYESALKPSTTLSQAERDAAVRTGIDNELPVSKAGVQKLYDLVDDYNQKIAGEINSDPTRPIDPNKVATRADLAKAKFSNQVNAGGDLSAIEASRQQFLQEQGATPSDPAPPMGAAKAQAMKQGTYQVLKGKFGEQGSASVEAQKALARGLKEEIANQFPEISNLNASESRLLNLQPILERAVGRVSNHQLIGIGTPVAGAAAKAVTGSGALGVVTGVLKAVLDNPEMKSKLAIAVSKGAKIPIGQAAARVQAYSAALGSTASGAQAYSSGDNPNSPTTPQQ